MASANYLNGATVTDDTAKWTAFATRIMDCVSKAFRSVGTSPLMEDVIFWNLSLTKGLGMNEIVDKPKNFIEALKTMWGEAGAAVFEYKLVKEVSKEFNLLSSSEREVSNKRDIGVVLDAAVSAAWASTV